MTLIALFALVAAWPGWTLMYVHALAWPLVAGAAIFALGPALARRVPDITEVHVPGGLIKFEQPLGHADTDLTPAELWGPLPVGDVAEEAPEVPSLNEDDRADIASEALRVLATITGSYQIQLDLLRTLQSATDGLTHAAARSLLADGLKARGADPAVWNLETLIEWLPNQSCVTVTPDAKYQITTFGRRVIWALDLPTLFVAPKLY